MTGRELIEVVVATARVMRDSTRIADIHRVADITGRGRFAEILARVREDEPGRRMLAERPTLGPDDLDLEAMGALPADTLGGAFARHLRRHGLELYAGPPSDEYLTDPEVRYLVHRYRQLHDIWHVLLDLGTAGHEEVLVHAFTLGHLGLPNSAMIVVLGSLKHLVLERRWSCVRRGVPEAYRRGRAASELLTVPWSQMWSRPLDEVRAEVGVHPLRVA